MVDVYLDEDVSDLATRLRDASHDVMSAAELVPRGRGDVWHFRRAVDQHRVIVTLNVADYHYLHRLWTSLVDLAGVGEHHAGVLTAAQNRTFSRTLWFERVAEQLRHDIQGRMLTWLPHADRWQDDQWRAEPP